MIKAMDIAFCILLAIYEKFSIIGDTEYIHDDYKSINSI